MYNRYVKHTIIIIAKTENQNFFSVKIKKEFVPLFILSPEIVSFAGNH